MARGQLHYDNPVMRTTAFVVAAFFGAVAVGLLIAGEPVGAGLAALIAVLNVVGLFVKRFWS